MKLLLLKMMPANVIIPPAALVTSDGIAERFQAVRLPSEYSRGNGTLESYFIYLLARCALGTVRHMPRAIAFRFLDSLASLTYSIDTVHRRIARTNLAIAFPELPLHLHDCIARRSFQSVARNLLEVSHMRRLTPERVRSLVRYDPQAGLANFELARSRNQGILYLTGHFSAWELLPTAHALHGYPLSFVTRPLDNSPLEDYLVRIREAAGNQVISKRNSARRILEVLKKAGSVGILMDQNTSLQEGVFADFFGVPAATSSSIALLALRTEAAVLPGYLTPWKNGSYWIKFLPPVELIRTGDTNRDVVANTVRFNQVLEQIVREQPESWLWGHMRWKNRPEGTPDLYKLPPVQLREYLASLARARG